MARVEQDLIQEIMAEVKPQIEAMLADIPKWRRWAVFFNGRVGMKDFIIAFHSQDEARSYADTHPDGSFFNVVDMQKYLVD